ncbi:MAG: hypothetical protein JO022_14735 [Acidobacteriaceae bacterium]|nr:hypothetical protein [Acidobacteriaceae bacterium]
MSSVEASVFNHAVARGTPRHQHVAFCETDAEQVFSDPLLKRGAMVTGNLYAAQPGGFLLGAALGNLRSANRAAAGRAPSRNSRT